MKLRFRNVRIAWMSKCRLAVLCGGKSEEHVISLLSAKSILTVLDSTRYDIFLLAISRDGQWFLYDKETLLNQDSHPEHIKLQGVENKKVAFFPGQRGFYHIAQQRFYSIDVVLPVLHGPYGEDGSVQGFLRTIGIPFVGCGVSGSAVGMDKVLTKRLIKEAGFRVANFIVITKKNMNKQSHSDIVSQLGCKCLFVKPVNMGSSVGISKVENERQFRPALEYAFLYDHSVLIETNIVAREIEVSVLGNEEVLASLPGEIISPQGFYSYQEKYLGKDKVRLNVPADLPKEIVEEIQYQAKEVFKSLKCKGMARVDFFLEKHNKLIVNEVNTIPGFTEISMYPKLWEVSGLSYVRLIDRLIELALENVDQ